MIANAATDVSDSRYARSRARSLFEFMVSAPLCVQNLAPLESELVLVNVDS